MVLCNIQTLFHFCTKNSEELKPLTKFYLDKISAWGTSKQTVNLIPMDELSGLLQGLRDILGQPAWDSRCYRHDDGVDLIAYRAEPSRN